MGTRGHTRAQQDLLLTVDDVAAALHCSRRQVFRLIDRGDLPSVKPGRQRLVTLAALAAYVRPAELPTWTPPADPDPAGGRL